MKLSVIYGAACPPASYTEKYKFKYLRDCGFEACDYNIHWLSWEPISDEELKAKCLEVKAAAEEAGVEIYQTHGAGGSHPRAYRDDAHMIEVMIRDVKATAWLGCKYCVIHPYILPQRHYDKFKKESIDKAIEIYSSIKDYLEEYDVYCCLENMWNAHPIFKHIDATICSRAQEMVDMCEILGDRYKICVDTGHGELTGDDPVEMIRIAGKYLKTLHCHDTDSKSDLHTIPYVPHKIDKHAKRNNWTEMMQALKEVGYTGTLNFEACVPGPEALNEAGLKFLSAIGHYLISTIEGE